MSQQQTSTTSGRSGRGIRDCLSIADCLTVANGMCGLIAVVCALGSVRVAGHAPGLSHGRLVLCASLIVTGGILDLVDGAVARLAGASGMGTALDTMSDTLTFGVAPAAVLVAAAASEPTPWRWLALPVGCVFVAAAMLRLARFATFPAPGGGYLGLPMPAAAGAALALIIAHPSPELLLGGILLTSALMVSEVPYPHPDGRTIPLLCGYWAAVAGALAGWLPTWPVVVAWLIVVPLVPMTASVRADRDLLARVPADGIRAFGHAVWTVVHRPRVA